MVKKFYLGDLAKKRSLKFKVNYIEEETFKLNNYRVDIGFDKKLDEAIEYFVEFFGAKYRQLIETKLKTARYLFTNNAIEDNIEGFSQDLIELKGIAYKKIMQDFYKKIGFTKAEQQKCYKNFCTSIIKFSLKQFKDNTEYNSEIIENLFVLLKNNLQVSYEDWKKELLKGNAVLKYIKIIKEYHKKEEELEHLFNNIFWQEDEQDTITTFTNYLVNYNLKKITENSIAFSLEEIYIVLDYCLKRPEFTTKKDKKDYLKVFKKLFKDKQSKTFEELMTNFGETLKVLKNQVNDSYHYGVSIIQYAYNNCNKNREKQLQAIKECLINDGCPQHEIDLFMDELNDYCSPENDCYAFAEMFNNSNCWCVLPKNVDSESSVHELLHLISGYTSCVEYDFKTGVSIYFERTKDDLYNNLNEILTEFYALQNYYKMKKNNFELGDVNVKTKNNAYSFVVPVMYQFFSRYKETFDEAFMDKSIGCLIEKFGAHNLGLLDKQIGNLMQIVDRNTAEEDEIILTPFLNAMENEQNQNLEAFNYLKKIVNLNNRIKDSLTQILNSLDRMNVHAQMCEKGNKHVL